MTACPGPFTGGAFLSGVLDHLDCQARTLGSTGYQLLAAPASPVSVALTALVTLFVALFGIRMVLGHVPDLREGVVGVVKVGVVLLLAASWPAFRTIVYDVVLHGPAEIAGTIGQASALPGAGGGLTARLQRLDDAMVALGARGSGRSDLTARRVAGEPATSPIADDLALGSGRVAFLGGVIASFATLRLAGGLLLALAPLFAALLLFDATRGAFIGWLRALFLVFLGGIGVAVLLGVQLALAEPWIGDILQRRAANIATLAAPAELLVLNLGFAVAMFVVLGLLARLAFHDIASASVAIRQVLDEARAGYRHRNDAARAAPAPVMDDLRAEHGRVVAIADAIAASQRREAGAASGGARAASIAAAPRAGDPVPAYVPLGQSYRTRPRRSATASRRDRRA